MVINSSSSDLCPRVGPRTTVKLPNSLLKTPQGFGEISGEVRGLVGVGYIIVGRNGACGVLTPFGRTIENPNHPTSISPFHYSFFSFSKFSTSLVGRWNSRSYISMVDHPLSLPRYPTALLPLTSGAVGIASIHARWVCLTGRYAGACWFVGSPPLLGTRGLSKRGMNRHSDARG